ncbi:LolA family protein [Paenibacillus harenae]|uniref:LolA family protein n=1 Tax=Paenibacillus harenae TaxID=306543 RepID=UPI000418A392|nr:sigma-E factor regulatory protein RseB domain-containing protein [Paenibacillus harenae]
MKDNEQKLSDYIDRLNAEQKPDEDEYSANSEELKELYRSVRLVRSLKEPAMPGTDFHKNLVQTAANPFVQKKASAKRKWGWLISAASVAAVIALLINFMIPVGGGNVVNAMEKAFQKVDAYHGTLEIVQSNANGESMTQSKLEVWADKDGRYYTKGLEGASQDFVTVNNGEQKWQVQPGRKQVHIFPAFPDVFRFQFELGNEIQGVKNASKTNVVGEDTVAGRKASILEVTPDGGLPYRIWVDKETKLPLQKETAMYNAIQYTITYSQIDFSDAIPESFVSYQLPAGYEEIQTSPEQIVTNLSEAEQIAGFAPAMPEILPAELVLECIAANQNLVKLYYDALRKQIIVQQETAVGELKPDPSAMIGSMYNGFVEIQSPVAGNPDLRSIRWQQDGIEYTVMGNVSLEQLVSSAESFMNGPLELPSMDEQGSKPQVEVPYDMEVENNEQKSVDAGSSPWRIDPVFVAQVFVSLQMSPEGITGEYPIDIEDLEMTENNGTTAIIRVNSEDAPSKTVYLERLVRQDATGIWTVVGYDPS